MFVTDLGTSTQIFLTVLGWLTVAAFVPMCLWPLQWARALGWAAGEDNHLAVYYGRCLGAVASSLGAAALYVAGRPQLQPIFFVLMAVNFAAMVLIHIYGAVRQIQPRTETFETILWLGLLLATLWCWPAA